MTKAIVLTLATVLTAGLAYLTILSSLEENVFVGGARILQDLWGQATLLDAYNAFFAFFLVIAYREKSTAIKILWFFGLCFLGSMAIGLYIIKVFAKAPASAGLSPLFTKVDD